MSSRPDLKLDWCSYEAAKYAVEHWHYSRTMPASKRIHIGVWENSRFIGAIIFSCGSGKATNGQAIGLAERFEVAELQRVALGRHRAPVSRMVAIALRMLKRKCPGLRAAVSFADPREGHHGGIYQAGGWVYVGRSSPVRFFKLADGRTVHNRVVGKQWGAHELAARLMTGETEMRPGKHKYLYPLDDEIRQRILPLTQPYPKRVGSIENDAPAIPGGNEGGVIPTPTLQEVHNG